jgi:DNA-binding transcriptional MerR regulator
MDMPAKTPQWYTSKNLVERFGVCAETIRKWEIDNRIPAAHRTAGGHRRYTSEHVAAIELLMAPPERPGTAVTPQ